MNQKKNRQKVLIQKAAIAAVLSVCLLQQVAAADGYKTDDKTSNSITQSVSGSGNASSSNTNATPAVKAPEDSNKKKPKITQDQAVAKIREIFPQFKEAELGSVSLDTQNQYPHGSDMVWNIQWNYQVGNMGYGFGSQVDAVTGEILQVDFSPWRELMRDSVHYPPTYTKEQAEELAKDLIRKIAPSLDIQKLKSQDTSPYTYGMSLFGPTQYSFVYNIPVNGLPSDDSVNVSIDGEGNIYSYNRSKSNLSYPSATPSIVPEKAKAMYANNLKMELAYTPVYQPYHPSNKMMLAYQPTNIQYGIVDARNGKFVDLTTGKDANMKPNTYQAIAPTSKQFTPHQGDNLTAEQAKATALSVLKPPAEQTRVNQNLQNDWYDSKVKIWYLSWYNPNPAGPNSSDIQFNARINASTGQILSIGTPSYYYPNQKKQEKKNPQISLEEAEKKANYWINLLYPDAAANLKLTTPSKESTVQDNGGFRFVYQQFVNGIPVNFNSVQMELGSRGELKSYETMIQPMNLEEMMAMKPTMTAEEARITYLDHFQMELRYNRVGPYDNNADGQGTKAEQRLVYAPKFNPENETVLNAVTGKFEANWYDSRFKSSIEAKDIQGTRAEAAFKKMIQAGVLKPDADGLVKPNDRIKLGDWMQWITNAVQPYYSMNRNEDKPLFKDITTDSPYYSSVSFFITKHWLKKDLTQSLRPENELTREQLAESVAQILEYEQIAKFLSKDLEVSQLTDAAEVQNKGAVALVLKLGVMSADNGKFNPKSAVTRTEAAELLMKLVELQGRIDSDIQQR